MFIIEKSFQCCVLLLFVHNSDITDATAVSALTSLGAAIVVVKQTVTSLTGHHI